MTFPVDALFERELAVGVALWDVSHLLPTHKTKRYRNREPETIDRVFVHHSGAMGKSGFEGLYASSRYTVRSRGWPGFAYTFWIQSGSPDQVDRDPYGRLVVYRGNLDKTRSYHTGGRANDVGVGVALQGNTTSKPLTWSHLESLEALLPAIPNMYPNIVYPRGLGWHSIAASMGAPKNKSACPGKHAERFLVRYKNDQS